MIDNNIAGEYMGKNIFKIVQNQARKYLINEGMDQQIVTVLSSANLDELFRNFLMIGLKCGSRSQHKIDENRLCQTNQLPSPTFSSPQKKQKLFYSAKTSSKSVDSQQTQPAKGEQSLFGTISKQAKMIETLKKKLQNTEKMLIVSKRADRIFYQNSITESIKEVQRREEWIEKMNEDQKILLVRLKQRDFIIEHTLSLLERN